MSGHVTKAHMRRIDSRRMVNSLSRSSFMLPYLMRRSVVGVSSGTESGITRVGMNLLNTCAGLAALMPEAGQDCLSTSSGEP
jgi:hypothetical protein